MKKIHKLIILLMLTITHNCYNVHTDECTQNQKDVNCYTTWEWVTRGGENVQRPYCNKRDGTFCMSDEEAIRELSIWNNCRPGRADWRDQFVVGTINPLLGPGPYGVDKLPFIDKYCMDCRPGTFSIGGNKATCQICPVGKYSGQGAGGCTNCPATTSSHAPQQGMYLPLGNNATGTKYCAACPAGSSSVEGGPCVTCPPGHYSYLTRADRSYNPRDPAALNMNDPRVTKNSGCIKCPANTYAPTGWGDKYDYSLGGNPCIPCPINTDSEPGSASCKLCPAGKGSIGGKRISPMGLTLSVADTSCKNCQPGTFSIGDDKGCQNCPAGQGSTEGATKCTPCKAGEFSLGDGKGCQACPKNTYSNETGRATVCIPCPAGSKTDNIASTACIPCKPGTYSEKAGTDCINCKRNWYSDISGATSCKVCPKNQGTIAEGLAQCVDCTRYPMSSPNRSINGSGCCGPADEAYNPTPEKEGSGTCRKSIGRG